MLLHALLVRLLLPLHLLLLLLLLILLLLLRFRLVFDALFLVSSLLCFILFRFVSFLLCLSLFSSSNKPIYCFLAAFWRRWRLRLWWWWWWLSQFYTLAVPVPPDSPRDPPAENPFGLPSEYAAVLQER